MSAKLSSDVLEDKFGPTELEILRQNDAGRIIATKTADNGRILELSQVSFRAEGRAAFTDIHLRIVAGTSMGKAFREAGVAFKRQHRAVYRSEAPAIFSRSFGTAGPPTIIDVSILAGPGDVPYADILEVYSPEVDWGQADTGTDQVVIDRLRAFGETLAATGRPQNP